MASEAQLQATGLSERVLATHRLVYSEDPPFEPEIVADSLGVTPETVKRHLVKVELRLEDPEALRKTDTSTPDLSMTHPEKFAKAVNQLSDHKRNIAATAREVGISPVLAAKIAKSVDSDLMPLKREIADVRLEDLMKRFGTLSRDAMDAVTPEKLEKANAQQLAIIAGIGVQNWQLLRGQPTQRVEIDDRREANEIVKLLLKEAARRGIEIDVTPEGGVNPSKPQWRSSAHKRMDQKIATGDPAETLVPA